ncbi:OsmC family protein [bacterium]|nr:OsmC family protein [bacterium]
MQNIVNGVDRDALFATIDAVKQDPRLAAFEFRVENEWMGGGLNRTTVRDFYGTRQDVAHEQVFEVYNDEPPVLLSGDKGPNPVENLLHALAGCLTTSIVYHAAAQGRTVDAVRSRFEGNLDLRGFLGMSDEVRRGYTGIRVVFDIEGDFSVEEKRELIAMGPKFSPVYDVVTNGTNVACMIAEDMTKIAAE